MHRFPLNILFPPFSLENCKPFPEKIRGNIRGKAKFPFFPRKFGRIFREIPALLLTQCRTQLSQLGRAAGKESAARGESAAARLAESMTIHPLPLTESPCRPSEPKKQKKSNPPSPPSPSPPSPTTASTRSREEASDGESRHQLAEGKLPAEHTAEAQRQPHQLLLREADVLRHRHKFADAIVAYDRVLALAPDCVDALNGKGSRVDSLGVVVRLTSGFQECRFGTCRGPPMPWCVTSARCGSRRATGEPTTTRA